MHFNTPLVRFLLLLFLIAGTCALILYTAAQQPSTGLQAITIDTNDRVLVRLDGRQDNLLAILRPDDALPASFPTRAALQAWLDKDGRNGTAVTADDFIEEPDMLPDYPALNGFFARQGSLRNLIEERQIVVAVADGQSSASSVRLKILTVSPQRPLSALPMAFWLQLGAGFLTCLVAAFFVALRPAYPPVLAFAAAGAGVAGAAFSAALYSTRHIALEPGLFAALSVVNQASTYLFGIGTIYLFALYPAQIVPAKSLWPVPVLGVLFLALYRMEWAPHDLVATQVIILVMLVAIIALVIAQYRATRGNPAGRTVLLWLGVSVLLGAGAFALLVALPVALGLDVLMTQSSGFVPLAAIYVGTALAIARFRLFDLGRWAYRILLYSVTLSLLFGFDAALVALLRLSPTASLAIAVAVTGLAYLPLRDFLFQALFRNDAPDIADLYRHTVAVGLQPNTAARASAWIDLLHATFQPVRIEMLGESAGTAHARLAEDGEQLLLPAFADLPAAALSFARQGGRLFNRRDVTLAGELASFIETIIANRTSYEHGVTEERERIARDLHDEVGATLLSGLHAATEERRRDCIVDALADVRQIASGLAGRDITLAALIAQMRHESRTRAELHGRSLVWPLDRAADESAVILPYRLHRNFHAIHREAISNALSHGSVGTIEVRSQLVGDRLVHEIANPFDARSEAATIPSAMRNHGSMNMQARAEQLDADLAISREAGRYAVSLSFDVMERPA